MLGQIDISGGRGEGGPEESAQRGDDEEERADRMCRKRALLRVWRKG